MIDILLITNKGDITTDFVVKELTEAKANFYRLNTEDLLNKLSLNFNFYKSEFTLFDNERKIEIDLLKIKSFIIEDHYRLIIQQIISQGEKKFSLLMKLQTV